MVEVYRVRAGAVAKDSQGIDQNLSAAIAVDNVIREFDTDTLLRPSLLTGVQPGADSTSNKAAAITAILEPNNEWAIRVTPQGATLTMSAPDAATVGAASAEAVAANTSRRYLLLVNTSSNVISLGFGSNAAVLHSGITLNANGGSYEISEAAGNLTTQAINAIAGAAGSNLSIQEGE